MYDAEPPKISCCFCVLKGRAALELAALHDPEPEEECRQVEQRLGRAVMSGLSTHQIIAISVRPVSARSVLIRHINPQSAEYSNS